MLPSGNLNKHTDFKMEARDSLIEISSTKGPQNLPKFCSWKCLYGLNRVKHGHSIKSIAFIWFYSLFLIFFLLWIIGAAINGQGLPAGFHCFFKWCDDK